jgi:hypothetical protein
MPFRFITKSIHTYLIDDPIAIVLMVAPFLLKARQEQSCRAVAFGGDPRHQRAA